MPKVLYVEMIDTGPAAVLGEGCLRRVVRVLLTEEQAELVKPQALWNSGNNPIPELVRPISIEEAPDAQEQT
jgi:hypothetical protein